MVNVRSIAVIICGVAAIFRYEPANALGTVSRACRFDAIPAALQAPAALLFYMLGADYSNMDGRGDKSRHWIFESITTDYGEVRYYLHAESYVYRWSPPAYGWAGDYVMRHSFNSGPFKSQMPADSILYNTKLDIFFHNRGPLYSARAGEGKIYTYVFEFEPMGSFKVLGSHSYWMPRVERSFDLGKSIAVDCNLTNWGIE